VVTDPGDPRGLEPGDVLVCALTDPFTSISDGTMLHVDGDSGTVRIG